MSDQHFSILCCVDLAKGETYHRPKSMKSCSFFVSLAMYNNFRNLALYVFPNNVKNWSTSAQNAKIEAVYLKKEAQKAIVVKSEYI